MSGVLEAAGQLNVNFNATVFTNSGNAHLAPLFKCEAARDLALSGPENQDALTIMDRLNKCYSSLDPDKVLIHPNVINRYLYCLAQMASSDQSTQEQLEKYSFQESTWGQSLYYALTYVSYLWSSDPKELNCSDPQKLGREEFTACRLAQSFFSEQKAQEVGAACSELDARPTYPSKFTESLGNLLFAAYDGELRFSNTTTGQLHQEWQDQIKTHFCEDSKSHPDHEKYCSEETLSPPANATEWAQNFIASTYLPNKVLGEALAFSTSCES